MGQGEKIIQFLIFSFYYNDDLNRQNKLHEHIKLCEMTITYE